MTSAAKMILLAAVLVVLAFAVSELRRHDRGFAPSASLNRPVGEDGGSLSATSRVRQQPTVLQPRPATDIHALQPMRSPRADESTPQMQQMAPTPFYEPEHVGGEEGNSGAWPPPNRSMAIPSPFQLDQAGADKQPVTSSSDQYPTHINTGFRPIEFTSPNPPAEERQPSSVVTNQRDSFWDISVRVYGVGDYYKALYLYNHARIRRPDAIAPGIVIMTPSPEQLRRLYPNQCPEPRQPAPNGGWPHD